MRLEVATPLDFCLRAPVARRRHAMRLAATNISRVSYRSWAARVRPELPAGNACSGVNGLSVTGTSAQESRLPDSPPRF